MSYPRNAWWVAAYSSDVKPGELFHRTILGDEIVFYRRQDGQPAALRDRCPHRFVPLHLGKLKNDVVECVYHGLRFDCAGKCVLNPHGDGKIPAAARVRSYPVVDKHGLLWIWTGEREHDVSAIPDYSMLDEGSDFRTSKGYIQISANYELMGENLLDLSHISFLHEGLLGSPEMVPAPTVVREEGNRLHCDRWMPNVTVPGVFDMLYRKDGKPVDFWTNMLWMPPGCFLLDTGVHAPGGQRERVGWYYGIHIVTPETPKTTHYHFAAARPSEQEIDAQTNARLAEMRRIAFEEQDKPIIDAMQRAIGDSDFWSMKPILLSIDAGPIRMRRMLERILKAEQSATTKDEAQPA